MSSDLHRLQRWFAEAVMSAPEPRDGLTDVQTAPLITDGPRQSRLERLEIYRAAYRGRLIECLADDYPAVRYALGERAFEALCTEYIAAHPSRSPSLNAYGRSLAAFVAASERAHAVFLRDLASLEWAIVEAIHRAPAATLDLAALADLPPERWARARLVESDAVRVFEFAYPVNAFFQRWREGELPDVPAARSTITAVYRRGWAVWRMDLAPTMGAVLSALFQGAMLGDALTLVEATQASQEDVIAAFRDWVAGGFFSRIELVE